jgi:hypothetical protein
MYALQHCITGALLLLLLLQTAAPEELATIQQLQLHTQPDTNGWTALHYAAAAHKVALVLQLLELGADPAAADKYGLTPLHLACMGPVQQHLQLLELWRACSSAATLAVSWGSDLSCALLESAAAHKP